MSNVDKRFSVVESTPGVYELTRNSVSNSQTKIYVTHENNRESQAKKLLVETIEETVTIKGKFETRPYFIIENEKETYLIGTRNIRISGMNNFRDMGGYASKDRKYVKWGVLYRSDQPGNATKEGLDYLNSLGIHTIIDYRSSDEINKYPNPDFPIETVTYHLDPNAHAAELAAQFQSSKEAEDTNLIASIMEQQAAGALVNRYDIVMEQYKSFATKEQSKQAFAAMLKAIAKSNAPAIDQHCRGGKDRTGFGSLLILGILGVAKEDIVADYMLTYSNRIERNEVKMANYRKITQDKAVLNYLYSLIETRPEFIEASYDGIITSYGSIETYVTEELGITASEVTALHNLYLE